LEESVALIPGFLQSWLMRYIVAFGE